MRIDVKGVIVPNDDAWIYDWFEMDNTCPKKVNDLIDKANGESLDVYINSGGGDVFAGSEIYSALRSYPGGVNIHVVGIAASAASVIAMAGRSDISPTAMLMVHNVSSGAQGDYHAMDKQSDILQTANKAVAAAYCEKTAMSEADVLKMMDKETWLTAAQAVERGLIDSISTPQNLQLVADIGGILPRAVIDKLKNELREKSDLESKDAFLNAEKLNLLKLKGQVRRNEI